MENNKIQFCLSSTIKDGLLVSYASSYEVKSRVDYENVNEFNNDVVKFDSIKEANEFIREKEYWALDAIEFTQEEDFFEEE